jgi:hypothetical protein
MNEICFFSSFVFITNIINNYLHNDYFYSGLFAILFFTSLLHHYYCVFETNIIDKISILGIILYGGNLYYKKILSDTNNSNVLWHVPLLCFWATIILYLYGDMTDQYCFDKTSETANKYHALLHCISSIGHNVIIMI